MAKKDCSRRNLLLKELIHDWDELNIAFKSLIVMGLILFLVVILIAIFSDGGQGVQNSLEVVFRSTVASVFGFLLSSNIKNNSDKKNAEIEKIKLELNKVQSELDSLEDSMDSSQEKCELKESYTYKNINLVQIGVALSIFIICISVLSGLLITENLQNVPAVSQIRDLMCSSVGFIIGESGKK